MNRRSVRLRPTGLWFLFGPILSCMWLAAVNYSNNLIYGVLYLIGSLTFVSIFHTWRNLSGLEIDDVRVHPTFAGTEARVEVFLRNRDQRAIYGLFFAYIEAGRRRATPVTLSTVVRVDKQDTRSVEFVIPAPSRGRYQLDSIIVRSSYPFGLIYASLRLRVRADYFVYPAPEGEKQLPEAQSGGDEGVQASPQPGDDFAGVRPYVLGESLRQVDWKAYARGRPLSTKQFSGGNNQELFLEASALSELPFEQRLSQLTSWILTAEKENIPYAIKVGTTELPSGFGLEQARRALEILAVAEER